MKKIFALLTALVLCLCLTACKGRPEQTEPTDANNASAPATTAAPTTQSLAEGETLPATDPTQPPLDPDMTNEGTLGEIRVPGPDEIPDPPDADYTIPSDERPGGRVTDVPKS